VRSVGVTPTIPEQAPAAVRTDAGWFAQEVHAHEASLRGYLKSAFPAMRDVDDIVQESFLRIWRRRAVEPVRSAKAFLFRVARNLALNTVRRERRSPIRPVTDFDALFVLDDRPNAAEAASREQELEMLVEAIEALPARCREIFILRRLQGVSQKEIAARLGLSEQTVQVQAARGLRRCEEHLRRRLSLP
jgi:RNA polymerase sigma-70 factor (ECF subfamily)